MFGHPNREISFGGGLRYNSFATFEEFEMYMTKTPPAELHIGAVYSSEPRFHREHNLAIKPVYREVVIDIDIDNYTNRPCGCQDATFCETCWKRYMNPTIKVIDEFLKNVVGSKQIVWAFSGRRGVHAFVLDSLKYDKWFREWIIHKIKELRIPPGIPVQIDEEVTKKINHLLRSPFSIHPKTGLCNSIFEPSDDYYPRKTR